MEDKHKQYALVIGMLGLGCIGTYLEINDISATFVWIGCFFCFWGLVD
jgi:hypothetical protein